MGIEVFALGYGLPAVTFLGCSVYAFQLYLSTRDWWRERLGSSSEARIGFVVFVQLFLTVAFGILSDAIDVSDLIGGKVTVLQSVLMMIASVFLPGMAYLNACWLYRCDHIEREAKAAVAKLSEADCRKDFICSLLGSLRSCLGYYCKNLKAQIATSFLGGSQVTTPFPEGMIGALSNSARDALLQIRGFPRDAQLFLVLFRPVENNRLVPFYSYDGSAAGFFDHIYNRCDSQIFAPSENGFHPASLSFRQKQILVWPRVKDFHDARDCEFTFSHGIDPDELKSSMSIPLNVTELRVDDDGSIVENMVTWILFFYSDREYAFLSEYTWKAEMIQIYMRDRVQLLLRQQLAYNFNARSTCNSIETTDRDQGLERIQIEDADEHSTRPNTLSARQNGGGGQKPGK